VTEAHAAAPSSLKADESCCSLFDPHLFSLKSTFTAALSAADKSAVLSWFGQRKTADALSETRGFEFSGCISHTDFDFSSSSK